MRTNASGLSVKLIRCFLWGELFIKAVFYSNGLERPIDVID